MDLKWYRTLCLAGEAGGGGGGGASAAGAAGAGAAGAAGAAVEDKGPSKKELQGQIKQLEGMLTRKTAETLEAVQQLKGMFEKLAQPAAGAAGQKTEQKTEADRIAALEEELKQSKINGAKSEKKSEVAKALTGVTFVADGAKDHVMSKLIDMTERREDGSYFLKMPRVLENTGKTIFEEIALTEGAKMFLKSNEWALKGNPVGGSGAAGQTAGGASAAQAIDWDTVKYRDLKANPGLMARALGEKGQEWISAKFQKYMAKRGSPVPGGGVVSFQKNPGQGPTAVNKDSSE